jgi:hypothetical protein
MNVGLEINKTFDISRFDYDTSYQVVEPVLLMDLIVIYTVPSVVKKVYEVYNHTH